MTTKHTPGPWTAMKTIRCISAVESALRHIDARHRKEMVLGSVSQWFLVLGMFKELEVLFGKATNKELIRQRHRAALSTIMGRGELLLADCADIPEHDFEVTGYSKDALAGNVRYLREKYEQWYIEADDGDVNHLRGLLHERKGHS